VEALLPTRLLGTPQLPVSGSLLWRVPARSCRHVAPREPQRAGGEQHGGVADLDATLQRLAASVVGEGRQPLKLSDRLLLRGHGVGEVAQHGDRGRSRQRRRPVSPGGTDRQRERPQQIPTFLNQADG
jgi:hypothetical protein